MIKIIQNWNKKTKIQKQNLKKLQNTNTRKIIRKKRKKRRKRRRRRRWCYLQFNEVGIFKMSGTVETLRRKFSKKCFEAKYSCRLEIRWNFNSERILERMFCKRWRTFPNNLILVEPELFSYKN